MDSLERGQRRISWNVGKKLFQCFGISCDYMMESGFRTEPLPDHVREEEEDSLYPKFRLLLGACNQAELIGCYEMCRNYLSSVRTHARFCNDPSLFDSADLKKDPVFEKETVSSVSDVTEEEPAEK